MHVTRGGGAFGRRLFNDAALEAVRMSKQVGKPVRLMWHRADECRAGRAHPMCLSRVRAVYSKSLGKVVSFEQRHTSVATDYTESFGDVLTSKAAKLPFANELGFSQTVFFLTATVPYDFGSVLLGYNEIFDFDTFATGSVRNLNNPDVRPAQELIIDRLAAQFNKDPLQFRLDSLEDGRARKVLETVRDEGEGGRELPDGVAQGIAVHEEYKGVIAVLADQVHSISPEPLARSSTRVPGSNCSTWPRAAGFPGVNGLWMQWLFSRMVKMRGRSTRSVP